MPQTLAPLRPQPPGDIPPVPVRQIMAEFVPDAIDFGSIDEEVSRDSTVSSVDVLAETEGNGVRIIKDPGMNDRLLAALDNHLPAHILASKQLTTAIFWKQALDDIHDEEKDLEPIYSERDLSDTMEEMFWPFVNLVLKSKALDKNLRGEWRSCESKNGGARSWICVRKVDGKVQALSETIMPSILRDTFDHAGRVQRLLEEASKPGGMRVIVTGEKSVGVVEEDGVEVSGMEYWANCIAQFWEKYRLFDTANIMLLSSSEIFLPLERDRSAPNILRVGLPIVRDAGLTGAGDGALTCFELAIASTLSLPAPSHVPPFLPLPKLKIETARSEGKGGALAGVFTSMCRLAGIRGSKEADKQRKAKRRRVSKQGQDVSEDRFESGRRASGSAHPSVWARLHFHGCSLSDSGRSLAHHFFGPVGLSDSSIYGWIDKDLIHPHFDDCTKISSSPPLLPIADPPLTPRATPRKEAPITIAITAIPISAWSSSPTLCASQQIDASSAVDLEFSIGSLIDRGRLSDVYSLTSRVPANHPDDLPPLVIKIMRPSTFDDAKGSAGYETGAKAVDAWEAEVELYGGVLSCLQGHIVPRCFGAPRGLMYVSREWESREINFMILERVGSAVCAKDKDLPLLPLQTKLAICSLYEALHSVRIIHGDIERRHIRRRADGSLCIIDFEGARRVSDGAWGDEMLADEMEEVEAMLGLGNG
ncbi:hypothetical protein L202_00242 [Cryptococcus amylolentus CBS 6039]|uniref:Protein kinase domain-containing protein n=1 Tax=Cryptococcus amylolentus CBS 6039 TaxID=1295533 RepID=A0A1E3I6D3_9TREE|nr:hypothetical protein L202_00242 [Cryptococcus amylolentus CBS 6039]ODN84253.1 hypothetical protein L202_00242 [Cryptococcus amylolentus CBS 6039]